MGGGLASRETVRTTCLVEDDQANSSHPVIISSQPKRRQLDMAVRLQSVISISYRVWFSATDRAVSGSSPH